MKCMKIYNFAKTAIFEFSRQIIVLVSHIFQKFQFSRKIRRFNEKSNLARFTVNVVKYVTLRVDVMCSVHISTTERSISIHPIRKADRSPGIGGLVFSK